MRTGCCCLEEKLLDGSRIRSQLESHDNFEAWWAWLLKAVARWYANQAGLLQVKVVGGPINCLYKIAYWEDDY